MAMNKESAKELYLETYERVTSDGKHWKQFLNTASNVYRYNFASQLMIYAQRPDATACASFNVWSERMNRKIKYGSKGIALYDDVRGEQTYVFDISDTKPMENSRPMNLWKMEIFHQKQVLDRLSSIMGIPLDYNDGFAENIMKVTRQYAEEQYRELEDDYRREKQSLGDNDEEIEQERNRQITFLASSIGYSVLKRCGMSLELLDKQFNFDEVARINKEQIMALGDFSASMTAQILQEVKNAVREYDREHFDEEYAEFENFILANKRELLSYDPRISLSNSGKDELNAISINIQEKNHDFVLVLMDEGIFVTRVNAPQGLVYKDTKKIFDENAVLSKNAKLIPLKEAPGDIKYEILMHSSRYKDCINTLKYELEERMSKNENAVQNGQQRITSTDNQSSETDRGSNQIRDDEITVSSGTQENPVEQIENGNVINGASAGYSESGRGTSGTIDRTDEDSGESERGSEEQKFSFMDSEDEQHNSESRGNSNRTDNRKLTGNKLYIYQIDENSDQARDIKFESYERIIKKYPDAVNSQNYKLVYEEENLNSDDINLDHVYERFNIGRPEDFTGHSLSVSDVVVREINGTIYCDFCDSFGWKRVPNFLERNISQIRTQEKQATITCEWSEHNSFEDGKTYSVEDFDRLMKAADTEWVQKNDEGIKKYGSREAFCNAENEPLQAYLGYAKVKFSINMPDGTSIVERQDVGDGYGGLIDFLSLYPQYSNVVSILKQSMPERASSDQIEASKVQNVETTQEQNESKVYLSVHECGEFHSMGKNYENLSVAEAVEIYKRLRETSSAYIPAISINVEGTERPYLHSMDIFSGDWYGLELLNFSQEILENEAAVQLIVDLMDALPAEFQKRSVPYEVQTAFNKRVEKQLSNLSDGAKYTVRYQRFGSDKILEYTSDDISDIQDKVEQLKNEELFIYGIEKGTDSPDEKKIEQKIQLPPVTIRNDSSYENFHFNNFDIAGGSDREKFRANIEAIKTLKIVEKENRNATAEEKKVLSKYVGWGGLSDVFDSSNVDWTSEYDELKGLLSEDEYRNARASTTDAFYTNPEIADCMYEALQNMGFSGGNVLEPSMGVGNFFGSMPESLEKNSKLYGVELDSLSGRMAKALYPKADITIDGFEKTNFPNDFFDVVIGNVPFGETGVYDRDYKNHNFLIHDYFIAKSIDKVRTGGVVAVITSKGSMDKANENVRKYINERAELMGAVRLPNSAFKKNAGAVVTSDILFFKKRDAPSYSDSEWLHTVTKDDGMVINSYFDSHPEMVLGTMKMTSGRYGMVSTCVPNTETPFVEQLRMALSHIETKIDPPELMTEFDNDREVDSEIQTIPADPEVRNFSYTLKDDTLYFRENSVMRTLNDKEARGKGAERIRGLLKLRNITTDLLNMQLDESVAETQLIAKMEELNSSYDDFVKKYGIINSRANKTAFQNDSSYNLLCSLEKLDDDGNLEGKADIFTKRTISIRKEITHTDSSVDALAVSLADTGRVDIEKMAKLTGKSEEDVINDLYGVIFKNPANNKWETSEEYLSGDIREKLNIAEKVAQIDSVYDINVDALRKALPPDLSAEDIDARLGSTWIDPEYIKDFMIEVLNTPRRNFEYGTMDVNFSEYGATWGIRGKQLSWGNVKVREVYGVKDVIDAYQLLELSLNLKEAKIYKTVDEGGKEKRVLDHDKTILAQQKQSELKEAFKEWIWKDFDRREKLVRKYNDLFNSTVPRHYDGSHLKFDGSNPSISLLPHQKNAVARVLYGGNTLLAHCVGAGKTYTMIASAMEKKRLGLCHKSLITVPNHLTEQWGADFLKLYPNAKILVATKKDFEPNNRKKFCSRIATGDYDAVIIGHSQFEKIPLSVEKQQQMIEQQMDEITMAIQDARESGGDRLSIKQLEKTRKSLEKNLAELNDVKKDDVVTFEQLGIDSLYVDESHMFKNLYVYTKMSNVAGIQTTESKKATDMYNKCMYLDEITGGKGITFATGTPIANTMAELYTNMRYLQNSLLKKTRLSYFDAWASTFGETVTALEIKPEGNGFRTKTRFAKFFNLPELVKMWKESADIQTKEMLPDLMARLPKVEQHNIVLKPSEEQKMIVAGLAKRADAVRNRQVQPDEDNLLKITNDGRKLALDQRLINPLLPDDENSKINACVKQAVQIWKDTEKEHSTQVIFCDLSTPKAKSGNKDSNVVEDKFSVYDDIKKKLIEKGVPAEEIAFIHDANTESQKAELFSKINKGKVRFILGSTEKMGAGTNIQKKLVALHHIDVPWRPADLEQQEGRIVRQGNENGQVHIYRYVKEDTFDGYSWQTIENKNRFITQIMTDKSPVRRADDVDETVLDNATIKGLCVSDKRIKEKMDLDIDVQKLELLRSGYIAQIHQFEKDIRVTLPTCIENTEKRITGLKKDMEDLNSYKNVLGNDGFEIIVKGIKYSDKKNGSEAFLQALKNSIKLNEDKNIAEYMGFKISSEFEPVSQTIYVNLEGNCTYKVEMGLDAGGCIIRMNNKLNSIVNDLEKACTLLDTYKKSLEEAKIEVLKPFPKEEELITKKARLIELNATLNHDHSDKMTFYVAENIECESSGKCVEDLSSLSEAKEIFDKMPDGAGKGIGFKYKNMKYVLVNEKCIDADSIYRIEEFKNVAVIQKAVKSAMKLFPEAKVIASEKTMNELNKKIDESR